MLGPPTRCSGQDRATVEPPDRRLTRGPSIENTDQERERLSGVHVMHWDLALQWVEMGRNERADPSDTGREERSQSGESATQNINSASGRLAQLGERLPYKQEAACSSHAPPIAGNRMIKP